MDKREIKKLNLDPYLINLASQQDPNNKGSPINNLFRETSINSTTSRPPVGLYSDRHFYAEGGKPNSQRTPWIDFHSRGYSPHYTGSVRISIGMFSNVEDTNYDPETKRRLI